MSRKIDLQDVTFLLPVRLDSVVRLENLLLSTEYLRKNFQTNILVLQAGDYENGLLPKLLHKSVSCIFIEDYDEVFYRTMYINLMVNQTTTPMVAVWDADVIVPAAQIEEAVQSIREGFDVAYPYDGHFYDTSEVIREEYLKTRRLSLLVRNTAKMRLIYGDDMKGGGFIINRDSYIRSGKENEDFYGWGPEDFERFTRWTKLDYRINRVKGNLYHLTHGRGGNSTFRSRKQKASTNRAYVRTLSSSKEELQQRVLEWDEVPQGFASQG